MATLIGVLVAMASTLPGRVLTALGIGWVTYAGLSTLIAAVVAQVQASWAAMPATVLNLLNLAGFGEGLGIVLGALVARVSLLSIARLGKVT